MNFAGGHVLVGTPKTDIARLPEGPLLRRRRRPPRCAACSSSTRRATATASTSTTRRSTCPIPPTLQVRPAAGHAGRPSLVWWGSAPRFASLPVMPLVRRGRESPRLTTSASAKRVAATPAPLAVRERGSRRAAGSRAARRIAARTATRSRASSPRARARSLAGSAASAAGRACPAGSAGRRPPTPLREAKASLIARHALRCVVPVLRASRRRFGARAARRRARVGPIVFTLFVAVATAIRRCSRCGSARARSTRRQTRTRRSSARGSRPPRRSPRRRRTGVTVAELASRLKIDAVKAEKLLTQLAVHDRTRIDVDDDAEVRYSVSPGHRRVERSASTRARSSSARSRRPSRRRGRGEEARHPRLRAQTRSSR